MALRIIGGTRGDYGFTQLIEQFRAASATNVSDVAATRSPRLIVPTSGDRRRILRELAAGGDVLLGGEVLTFDAYVPQLAHVMTGQRTTAELEVVLLRRLIQQHRAFAGAARFPGFVRTAHRHVVALRMARVCGEEETARVTGQLPGGAPAAWHALVQAFGEQLDELGFVDDAQLTQQALTRLAGEGAAMAMLARPVMFGGFDDLSAHQLRIVTELARHVDVTVSFPFEPGRVVFERRQTMVDQLGAAGGMLDVVAADRDVHPTLAQLELDIFESTDAPDAVGAADGTFVPIMVCECAGPLQEAEEVVREVGMLRAAGVAAGEIAVMSAAPQSLQPYLAAAFRRAQIPVTMQVVRSALDTPAGRAIGALLDAVCDDDPLRMIAALRSRVSPLESALVDQIELDIRRALAVRNPSRADGWWLQLGTMRALPSELVTLVQADPTDIGDAMRRAVAAFVPRSDGDLRLLEAVITLIDSLRHAGPDTPISRADVHDALTAFTLDVPDHNDPDSVLVTSIVRGRSLHCGAVVLHGLDMSSFAVQAEDDADVPLVARELLHAAITRPDRALRIVRQTSSADGTMLAPHPVWIELAPLVASAPHRSRELADVLAAPADITFSAELFPVAALAAAEDITLDNEPTDIATRRGRLEPHARTASVGPQWRALDDQRDHLRVTEVETFTKCSARWLITSRLLSGLGPDEDPTIMIRGSVAHAALEQLLPDMAHNSVAPTEEVVTSAVTDASREVDRRRVLQPTELTRISGIVYRFLQTELVRGTVYIEQRIGAPIASHTADTDPSADADASAIAHPSAPTVPAPPTLNIPPLMINDVPITGRIDRIDVAPDNTAVLHDYKFRSSCTAGKKLIDNGELQLLAYWLAMRNAGPPVPRPVAAVYRALTGDETRGIVDEARAPDLGTPSTDRFEDNDIGDQLDRAEQVLTDAVAGILAGHAEPLTSSSQCVKWCTLHAICRIGASA